MNNTNGNLKINAMPTKDFFISMLVKDIVLVRAIIDLVDNSLDGAKRIRGEENYSGFNIRIEAKKDNFKISDNCGGIPVDIARNYAFRFGRPGNARSVTHSIGLFGVGMKRTIFKLGKKFEVESRTENSHFIVKGDIEEWKTSDKWEFDFDYLNEDIEVPEDQRGTTITVTDLHENITNNFNLDNFQRRLATEIEDAHINTLNNNLAISLNEVPLTSHPIELLNSDEIKPAYKELILSVNGNSQVSVKMYAGIIEPDPKAAGWYVFCNGRLVLKADRSEETGWGTNVPQYHNDYAMFRGYAFFDSDDARLLPWNTTKTGVDVDSSSFRAVRSEMIILMRPVIDFLRKLRKEKSDQGDSQENPLELAVEKTIRTKLFDISKNPIFIIPKAPSKRKPKTKTNLIRYHKPIAEVKQVQEVLGISTYKEVGEKTFEYFYERECEE